MEKGNLIFFIVHLIHVIRIVEAVLMAENCCLVKGKSTIVKKFTVTKKNHRICIHHNHRFLTIEKSIFLFYFNELLVPTNNGFRICKPWFCTVYLLTIKQIEEITLYYNYIHIGFMCSEP